MPTDNKPTVKKWFDVLRFPFSYDAESQFVLDADGESVLEIGGLVKLLTNIKDDADTAMPAIEAHDAFGQWVTDTLNKDASDNPMKEGSDD